MAGLLASMLFSATPVRTAEHFAGMAGVHVQPFENPDLLAINAGQYESGFALCTRCGSRITRSSKPFSAPRWSARTSGIAGVEPPQTLRGEGSQST